MYSIYCLAKQVGFVGPTIKMYIQVNVIHPAATQPAGVRTTEVCDQQNDEWINQLFLA